MKIASVNSEVRGETDRLLAKVSHELQSRGILLAGIVMDLEHSSRFENGCDMNVRVLPDGPVIQITQDLGAGSGACRLNPTAIAEAVSVVENSPLDTADLFILNKFGPEEAAGRGFVSVIGRAIENGVPVLVGVGSTSSAFDAFNDGLAERLPSELDSILDWCVNAVAAQRREEAS